MNRRTAASSFAIRSVTGICSPGISVATMIVFLDVSIPRWISPCQ